MTSSPSDRPAAIPEPTIVVGLGRFGLSVLERMGETWERLRDATADARLGNLRLLHVHGLDDQGDPWRSGEATARALADAIGEGDLPLRAIDFLFLRTLGLIRFHRGTYEVAVARDRGVAQGGDEQDVRRLRVYTWRELSPDPLRAVDVLALRTARESDLDIFLAPLLSRIRAGQLPEVIEAAIVRASDYAQGRDPAPWPLDDDPTSVDPEGRDLDRIDALEWTERVCDAGARVPRAALDEALARRLHHNPTDEIRSGHLGTPAERERLHLDDALLAVEDLESTHARFFGERSPTAAMLRPSASAEASQRSDLLGWTQGSRAVVGIGGMTAAFTADGEFLRRRFTELDDERRTLCRALRTSSFEHLARDATQKRHDARRVASEAGGTPASERRFEPVQDSLADERERQKKQQQRTWTEANRVLGEYQRLLDAQRALLGDSHVDVRNTLRARAELLRFIGGHLRSLERVGKSGADVGGAAGSVVEYLRGLYERTRAAGDTAAVTSAALDGASPEAGAAPQSGEETTTALRESSTQAFRLAHDDLDAVGRSLRDAGVSPADPEFLATLHARADVQREQRRGHLDPNGAAPLEQVIAAGIDDLDTTTRQRAYALQLLARHRLARLHEDEGDLEKAAQHLVEVVCPAEDGIGPEHQRTAAAHRIAAAHALGRIWKTQRRYAAAQWALEQVLPAPARPTAASPSEAPKFVHGWRVEASSTTVSTRTFSDDVEVGDAAQALDAARATLERDASREAPRLMVAGYPRAVGSVRTLRVEPVVGEGAGTKRRITLELELDAEGALLLRCGAFGRLTLRLEQRSPDEAPTFTVRLEGLTLPPAVALRPEHERAIDSHRLLAFHDLAATLMAQERHVEAKERLQQELRRRRELLGPEHPDTLAIALDLATALRELAASLGESAGADQARLAADIVAAVRAGHAPESRFDPRDSGAPVFDPREILGIPWEASGWTNSAVQENDGYRVAEMPLWLHGCFDSIHDENSVALAVEQALEPRLRAVGELCKRGMLEMFWEMRLRERPEVVDEQGSDSSARAAQQALLRSTDLIAEMIFRPFNNARGKGQATAPVRPLVEAFALPEHSSARLAAQRPPVSDPNAVLFGKLDARLAELGALPPQARRTTDFLFNETALPSAATNREGFELRGFELRRIVRELVTHLVSFDYLAETREQVVGATPRLSVYVVADLGEPFSRSFVRSALQLLHAELLRTFATVFKDFRGGFDRNLAIVPILWLPNPSQSVPARATRADDFVLAVRHEEAAVGDTLLNLQRDISRMPNRDRFIPNAYLCSRVNDAGSVTLEESVLQTHDFLSFSMRSHLGSDDWLRALSTGPFGKDFFATFGCLELEVPVERIREYLSGRLARVALGDLLHTDPTRARTTDPERPLTEAELRAQDDARLLAEHAESLSTELQGACETLADAAAGRYDDVPDEPDADEAITDYGVEAATQVAGTILQGWPPIVAKDGTMDRLIAALRERATVATASAVVVVRERDDAEVKTIARGTPVINAVEAISRCAAEQREALDKKSRELEAAGATALAEKLPDPLAAVTPLFEEVRADAEKVPRKEPMQLGIGLVALCGMAGLAALAHTVNLAAEFERAPQPLEWLLGPLAPFLGVAIAAPLTHLALRAYRRRTLRRLAETMRRAAEGIRAIVVGESGSILSFLRSRVDFASTLVEYGVVAEQELQARIDHGLARRLRQGAEQAGTALRERAETLGVETSPVGALHEPFEEKLAGLVAAPGGARPALVEPGDVLSLYADRIGLGEPQRRLFPDVIAAGAGLATWRTQAPFSDLDGLLAPGRARFADLLDEQSPEDPRFAPGIRTHLADAGARLAPGLGLPGHVQGSEGLDDDGIVERARNELVAAVPMMRAARGATGATRLRERVANVRSHAAYLLTLVQGMALHLPLLHRRFMGYHDRTIGPSHTTVRNAGNAPVHVLTGREPHFDKIYAGFDAPRSAKPEKSRA